MKQETQNTMFDTFKQTANGYVTAKAASNEASSLSDILTWQAALIYVKGTIQDQMGIVALVAKAPKGQAENPLEKAKGQVSSGRTLANYLLENGEVTNKDGATITLEALKGLEIGEYPALKSAGFVTAIRQEAKGEGEENTLEKQALALYAEANGTTAKDLKKALSGPALQQAIDWGKAQIAEQTAKASEAAKMADLERLATNIKADIALIAEHRPDLLAEIADYATDLVTTPAKAQAA